MPNDTVADKPVKLQLTSAGVIAPTEVVELNPVKPITSAGAKDPQLDVARNSCKSSSKIRNNRLVIQLMRLNPSVCTPVKPITSAGSREPIPVVA